MGEAAVYYMYIYMYMYMYYTLYIVFIHIAIQLGQYGCDYPLSPVWIDERSNSFLVQESLYISLTVSFNCLSSDVSDV